MLHYKACARTRWAKAKDIALMVFGIAAAIFTTIQTIKVRTQITPSFQFRLLYTHEYRLCTLFDTIQLMVEPGPGEEPQFGVCSPAQPGDSTPLQVMMNYLGLNV